MGTEQTTTPDRAPGGETPKLRIEYGMLVEEVDRCTCGAGGEHGHEPGCGLDPWMPVSVLVADLAELARVRPVVDAAGDSPAGDLIDRNDDWRNGYRAGAETSHRRDCTAAASERDHLREELERCQVVCEQRIADLQAEFARQFKVAERQRDQARASLGGDR